MSTQPPDDDMDAKVDRAIAVLDEVLGAGWQERIDRDALINHNRLLVHEPTTIEDMFPGANP